MAVDQLQLLAFYLCLFFYSGKRFDFMFKAFGVFDGLNVSRKLVPEFEPLIGEASLGLLRHRFPQFKLDFFFTGPGYPTYRVSNHKMQLVFLLNTNCNVWIFLLTSSLSKLASWWIKSVFSLCLRLSAILSALFCKTCIAF